MRFLKIFLLHFEGILEHRFRSFVWFLIPVVNIFPMILFWTLAVKSNPDIAWSMKSLNTYYLILIIAMTALTSHIEESVSEEDIKQGELSKYLLKPVSYYWIKLFEELPYRMLQGSYSIILFLFFYFLLADFIKIDLTAPTIIFGAVSSILAFFISFTFKMIVGYSAFWTTDNRAIQEMAIILGIIFAGQVVPLHLFPDQVKTFVLFTPFASMVYYPVYIFLGGVNFMETLRLISLQLAWLAFFLIAERILWKKGIKEFTAIGQ